VEVVTPNVDSADAVTTYLESCRTKFDHNSK
jgi:hypothetical protein